MVGDGDCNLCHVVLVVRLRQLVAHARMQGVRKPAGFSHRWDETGVYGDTDDVVSRRHRRLAISSVENEILPLQLPDVEIGPFGADALVARNAGRSADGERRL